MKLTGKNRSTRRKSSPGATLSITPLLQRHSLRAQIGLQELDARTKTSSQSVCITFFTAVLCTKCVLTSGTLRNTYTARQRAIVQSIATKLQLHNREIVVRFPIKKNIFILSPKASRPALEAIQPQSMDNGKLFHRGQSHQGVKPTTHLQVPQLGKKKQPYLHSLINLRLYGGHKDFTFSYPLQINRNSKATLVFRLSLKFRIGLQVINVHLCNVPVRAQECLTTQC